MNGPDLFLTVKEAAALMRVGRDTAYQLAHSGAIPCVRLGKQFRIPRASLIRFMEAQAEAGTTVAEND